MEERYNIDALFVVFCFRLVVGPVWRARNIVTMAEIESLPVGMMVDLFLANLSNLSANPPSAAAFAVVNKAKEKNNDKDDKDVGRTVFDKYIENGEQKVKNSYFL